MNGLELRAWRESKGLSQSKAALVLGITRQSIIQYERGRYYNGNPCKKVPRKVVEACSLILTRRIY